MNKGIVVSIALFFLCLRSSHADLDLCYQALYDADISTDRRIDQAEYSLFLQLLQPQVVNATDFATLPLSLQSTFNTLACDCLKTESEDCCIGDNAHLPNMGTGPDETPTEEQQSRLSTICFFVEESLDRIPTVAPNPTAAPSERPTIISPEMTASPSATLLPTSFVPNGDISKVIVTYTIVARNGAIERVDVEADLISAMNDLVVQLLNRRLLRTRRLQQVQLPTTIVSITTKDGFTMTPSVVNGLYYDGVGPCPADLGDPATDLCQEVIAAIDVVVGSDDVEDAKEDFELAVNVAILQGRLQDSIRRIRPESAATVLTGQATSLRETALAVDREVEDNSGISAAGTIGIIVSGCAVIALFGLLLVSRRQPDNSEGKKGDKDTEENLEQVSTQTLDDKDLEQAITIERLESRESSVDAMSDNSDQALAKNQAENIKLSTNVSSKDPRKATRAEKDCALSRHSEDSAQSESGWSTDNDHSSMGTADSGSLKADAEDDENRLNTKMVDLQDLEIIQKHDFDSSERSIATPLATSVIDLEQAIMIGDWAAVGSSAAALASGAFDNESDNGDVSVDASYLSGSIAQSMTEEWKSRETSETSWLMATDAKKAMELDQLIEKGDWEAVIQAAARFEAEQHLGGDSTTEYQPSADSVSVHNEGDSETHDRPPIVVRSAAIPVKESSFRTKVMSLIKQVVPEELDNIDDMLEQFEGREEDLIETLKAMESRS